MVLTLNLPPEAEARLRRRAKRTGISPEEAARKVVEAAQSPPTSLWFVLGLLLILALFQKEPDPETEAAIRAAFQPYVDHLLTTGTEEELAALLPKLPSEETKPPTPDAENAAVIALLRQWREEDDAMTPAEAEEAEADWKTLQQNFNRNRVVAGEEPVF